MDSNVVMRNKLKYREQSDTQEISEMYLMYYVISLQAWDVISFMPLSFQIPGTCMQHAMLRSFRSLVSLSE